MLDIDHHHYHRYCCWQRRDPRYFWESTGSSFNLPGNSCSHFLACSMASSCSLFFLSHFNSSSGDLFTNISSREAVRNHFSRSPGRQQRRFFLNHANSSIPSGFFSAGDAVCIWLWPCFGSGSCSCFCPVFELVAVLIFLLPRFVFSFFNLISYATPVSFCCWEDINNNQKV